MAFDMGEGHSPSPFRAFGAPSLSQREREGARSPEASGKGEGRESRRTRVRFTALVAPILLFLLGAAALFAAERHLWANTTLALLLALWLAAADLLRTRRRETTPPPPATTWMTERAREQRRLIAYLDLSPAPLVTLDGEDRLYAVNRAARRLFGCDDRVPDPPAGLIAAIGGAVPGRSASVRLAIAGETRDFALTIADLTQAGAGLRIAALVDIGAELRAAEASALRELLQVLSHEIMNALTPIASLGRTAADMLAERGDDLADVRDAVETVARRAEGLERFTTAYRDLARLPPPAIRRIDPRLVIGDVTRMASVRWPALAIAVDADRAPATIAADPDQLHAALWAIVQNAAEAAAATLRITATATPTGTAIAAVDDGPGIPRAEREAVFRPFFTTKAAGSGVGLALVRQIAHGHQGSAALDSGPGGTTVTIEIPGR